MRAEHCVIGRPCIPGENLWILPVYPELEPDPVLQIKICHDNLPAGRVRRRDSREPSLSCHSVCWTIFAARNGTIRARNFTTLYDQAARDRTRVSGVPIPWSRPRRKSTDELSLATFFLRALDRRKDGVATARFDPEHQIERGSAVHFSSPRSHDQPCRSSSSSSSSAEPPRCPCSSGLVRKKSVAQRCPACSDQARHALTSPMVDPDPPGDRVEGAVISGCGDPAVAPCRSAASSAALAY